MWTKKSKVLFVLYKVTAQWLPISQRASWAKKIRGFFGKRIATQFGANVNIERNIQISNELYIDANIESNNMEDRIFKKTLELRSFEQEKKDYWLIVKDVDEVGEPEIKLPFTINLVFSSDFDF